MNLSLDKSRASDYVSASQAIRILSEAWVSDNIFCPNCGRDKLKQYENNRPVADLFCQGCSEDYELKSKSSTFSTKVVDGAYGTMIERLNCSSNPNFFLLQYSDSLVCNFVVIPKHYFTPDIIEKRRPLSDKARRAGWVGCNIDLSRIPDSGRIHYVRNSSIVEQDEVLKKWRDTLFLKSEKSFLKKGWILDIMKCIELIPNEEFTLADMYEYESYLSSLHPNNKHIKDKIRQQLQRLRDYDYIEFSSRGNYKKILK